jgi:uncharacterized protein DUF6587
VNRGFDDVLVALALMVSAAYVLLTLGPKGLRRRLWAALARRAEEAPAGLHLHGVARRLRAAADKTARACGGCDGCGPEPAAGGSSEARVPLSKVGRRRG